MLKSLLALSISYFLLTPFSFSKEEKIGTKKDSAKQASISNEDLNDVFLTYQRELSTSPNNPKTLYNLALVEMKQSQLGWALAHVEESLYIAPLNKEAHTLRKKIIDKIIDRDREPPSEQVSVLNRALDFLPSMLISLLIGAALALFVLFSALSYKKAYIEISSNKKEKDLSFLFLAVFISLLPLYYFKFNNFNKRWACIVSKHSLVRSGPDLKHREVTKLKEGSCVLVENNKKGWVAVSTSNAQFGWVQSSDLHLARGRKLTLGGVKQ